MVNDIYLQRWQTDCQTIAKEPIQCERIASGLYAFGSELACLRLFYAYRGSPNVRFGWSENLKTFYVGLEERYGNNGD
jgi:hypothetical protein